MTTEPRKYPVNGVQRNAIHEESAEAETALKDAVPADVWPLIRRLVRAHRTRAALYGYMCESDEEWREYANVPAPNPTCD